MSGLVGKVCLVTGATRGLGKGIALQLGAAGATVYITGRTLKSADGVAGSLEETAAEISNRGGKCIPVQCDHSKDEDVQNLFERIKTEQKGRLDVLVNNAYAGVSSITKYLAERTPYWEQSVNMWDEANNVGLRNHYMCSVYAARLMVPVKSGLIVNVSSPGGLRYLFNVAYGVGKQACDRMAADCAYELRKHNVTFVSLWPGAVQTEIVEEAKSRGKPLPGVFNMEMETPEFVGIAVVSLATDPNVMKKSGRVLLTSDLADEYGFVDITGKRPPHFRSLRFQVDFKSPSSWSVFIPRWIKIPHWVFTLYGGKL